MNKIGNFIKNVWHATSPPMWAASGACALLVTALVTTAALSGCSTTERGLTREQALYSFGTNAVASLEKVVPFMPVPVSSTAEIVLAAAAAALGAWNTHQQLAIRKLQNGNGKTKPPPSPTVAAPPAPQPT